MKTVNRLVMSLVLFALLGVVGCGDEGSSSSSSAFSFTDENGETSSVTISSGTMKDSRDGQTYRTITVDGITWMAQNLNFKTDSSACYDSLPENCSKYGRLYNWNDAKTACPEDWHLSDLSDWDSLINIVERKYPDSVGWALKSTHGWEYDGENYNGKDIFGFNGLPAGYGYRSFSMEGVRAYFWIMEKFGYHEASSIYLQEIDDIYRGFDYVTNMYSVRCVKDENSFYGAVGSCDSTRNGAVGFYNGLYYACKVDQWGSATREQALNYELGTCDSIANDEYKVGWIGDSAYFCDYKIINYITYEREYYWKDAEVSEALGKCDASLYLQQRQYLDTIYTCESNVWRIANANEVLPKCTESIEADTMSYLDKLYKCYLGRWNEIKDLDLKLGICNSSIKGTTKDAEDSTGVMATYVCQTRFWRPLNIVEKNLGVCTKDGAKGVFDGLEFTCDASRNLWIAPDSIGHVVAIDSVLWQTDGDKGRPFMSVYTGELVPGQCPMGWHLPYKEWDALSDYVEKYATLWELSVQSPSSDVLGLEFVKTDGENGYWSGAPISGCRGSDYKDRVCSAETRIVSSTGFQKSGECVSPTYQTAGPCANQPRYTFLCVKNFGASEEE